MIMSRVPPKCGLLPPAVVLGECRRRPRFSSGMRGGPLHASTPEGSATILVYGPDCVSFLERCFTRMRRLTGVGTATGPVCAFGISSRIDTINSRIQAIRRSLPQRISPAGRSWNRRDARRRRPCRDRGGGVRERPSSEGAAPPALAGEVDPDTPTPHRDVRVSELETPNRYRVESIR